MVTRASCGRARATGGPTTRTEHACGVARGRVHPMKFRSTPIEEHAEVPLADDGQLETLLARFTARDRPRSARGGGTPCFLLSVCPRHEADSAAARLAE